MPEAADMLLHELGNEVQKLSLLEVNGKEALETLDMIKEDYREFRNAVEARDVRRRAQVLRDFENLLEDTGKDDMPERGQDIIDYVSTGLESIESYLQFRDNGRKYEVSPEKFLHCLEIDDAVNIDIKSQETVEAGDFLWVIPNTMIKNSYDHSEVAYQEIEIDIECYCEDEEMVIEYTDNGEGVPEQDIEKVMNPEKAGKGFRSSHEILDSLDGSLDYQDEDDWYFEVRLPISDQ